MANGHAPLILQRLQRQQGSLAKDEPSLGNAVPGTQVTAATTIISVVFVQGVASTHSSTRARLVLVLDGVRIDRWKLFTALEQLCWDSRSSNKDNSQRIFQFDPLEQVSLLEIDVG